jgi:small acid-soluble spore protein K (minor)
MITLALIIAFRRFYKMRNKAKDFPNQSSNKLEGDGPRAKAEYASRRADGTINTHPQERMRASNSRDSDTSDLF